MWFGHTHASTFSFRPVQNLTEFSDFPRLFDKKKMKGEMVTMKYIVQFAFSVKQVSPSLILL